MRKEVFILVGSEAVSGGPELAHQLCYTLNQDSRVYARMCYVDVEAPITQCLPVDCECREPYRIYETEHVRSIQEMDVADKYVIVPEGLTRSIVLFSKAHILLWWMSVDNYFKSTHGSNLDMIKQRCCMHMVQSHYAEVFCMEHFEKNRIIRLSDYINPLHGQFLYPAEYRENVALYNPLKGYSEIKPLIEKVNWIKWLPIVGLTIEQTILLMQSSKIYVDFGEHPGKDRIPREAAVNGCCVITNRKGSAAYKEDIPIPDKYKFEDPLNSLDDIEQLMRKIVNDFGSYQNDFEDYRDWIHGERERFVDETNGFIDCLYEGYCEE